MSTAGRFVDALKASVRARGMTYAQLSRKLRVSEPTVKRMFSRRAFTLARIEQILRVLDLELYDVARMSRARGAGPAELTLEQENALAKDERLLSVFWLLLNERTFADILEDYAITNAELTLLFARLARLQLIEWGAGERARLRVARDFRWRAAGPVKKAYGRRVVQEFVKGRFESGAELMRFDARDVSEESATLIRRRLERVAAEFNELAELDATLPSRKRTGFGLLVGCRPWEFWAMNALKKRKA